MYIASLLLSIAASILSIVNHFRVRSIERKYIQAETQGDKSPILIAGRDLNVVNYSPTFDISTLPGIKISPPSTIEPPSNISP